VVASKDVLVSPAYGVVNCAVVVGTVELLLCLISMDVSGRGGMVARVAIVGGAIIVDTPILEESILATSLNDWIEAARFIEVPSDDPDERRDAADDWIVVCRRVLDDDCPADKG
jgi:hypothetical protein